MPKQFDVLGDVLEHLLIECSVIHKKGKNHFDDPEEIAEAVQRAAKNSYRPPQVIADAAKQMLAISMNTIRLLQKQIKEYDKAIEKMLEAFLQTLTSIKGIGNIYAAGIIAEIGDINRFPSQAGLAKYAGLVWTQHQSSDFEAEDKRMIQGGKAEKSLQISKTWKPNESLL